MPTPDDLCRALELLDGLLGELRARNDVGTPGNFLADPQNGVATYHALRWGGGARGAHAYLAFAPYAWAKSDGITPLWVWVVGGLNGGVGNEYLDELLGTFEGVVVQHRNDEREEFSLFIPIWPMNKGDWCPVVSDAVYQVVNILEQLRELAGA